MTMGPYECNNCGAEVTAHGNTDTCSRCASVVRTPQPPDDVTRALLKAYREALASSPWAVQDLHVAIASYRAVHGDPP